MVLREFYAILILHPPILYGYGRNQCHWLELPFSFHSSFSRLPWQIFHSSLHMPKPSSGIQRSPYPQGRAGESLIWEEKLLLQKKYLKFFIPFRVSDQSQKTAGVRFWCRSFSEIFALQNMEQTHRWAQPGPLLESLHYPRKEVQ